jgi:polysaccharide biosynthesis/export protein
MMYLPLPAGRSALRPSFFLRWLGDGLYGGGPRAWALQIVLASALVAIPVVEAVAQTVPTEDRERAQRLLEQRAGRPVSEAEIVERLRQSGMTRSQARARLQQMGMDPGLADRYFDTIERGGEPPRGEASAETLNALSRIGVTLRGQAPARGAAWDTIDLDTIPADTLARETPSSRELPVFGRNLFRRATAQFQPVSSGPVDPDYRLGPGDQILLILTGDVEAAHALDVTREGLVFIPDVGQMSVAGLTLRQLEDNLANRLSRVYSGVGRGAGATTQFSATLGELRSNQVFLIGEVERPGAYQVSSVATVFNALYQARGPNDSGSFRRVQVRRGGQVIRTVDLYRYLVHGDNRDDIRLEQGDIVFVPPVERQVGIRGAVRRAALFELLEGESLSDLIHFAAGTEAGALLRRIQIDRIVPPSVRRPGVDRVLVDVDVSDLLQGRSFALQDGDLVQVFAVAEERRHRLVVTGEVNRPGLYEWAEGMSLWRLIDRAEGLSERAYTPRAHIFRLNEADGTRSLVRTPLLADAQGRPLQDVLLADRDSVVVYSRAELRNPALVHIDGFVKDPGDYALSDGMSIPDLILAAGGFLPGANVLEAEVVRPADPAIRSNTTAQVIRIPLMPELSERAASGGSSLGSFGTPSVSGSLGRTAGVPEWIPAAEEFRLLPDDRVFVRRAPGYEASRTVKLSGQILTPGTYVLRDRQERLIDVLERAGGLTMEANARGLQVLRDGNLVATNLPRALESPSSRFNIALQPGDSIHVPEFDPTVLVRGAVGFEARVLHVPGRSVEYYIDRAGGFEVNADRRRVVLERQNGERQRARRGLLSGNDAPEPGSTIFVPARPEGAGGINWDRVLTQAMALASTVATVFLVINQTR